jgi:hypothetical protein
VVALLDHMGIDDVKVIGLSAGGITALHASRFTDTARAVLGGEMRGA